MLYCLFCCCVGRRQLVIALQRMFAQIYRELLEESCCQLDKQAEAASIACVALLLSSGPWGQFLPYSEVFMGCHSLGRLPFCHQFLKRQQHFSRFTVNNCEDFCGLTYPIAQKKFWMESSSNLSLLLRWVMTWHGGSIPRSAERCRAVPRHHQFKTKQ